MSYARVNCYKIFKKKEQETKLAETVRLELTYP